MLEIVSHPTVSELLKQLPPEVRQELTSAVQSYVSGGLTDIEIKDSDEIVPDAVELCIASEGDMKFGFCVFAYRGTPVIFHARELPDGRLEEEIDDAQNHYHDCVKIIDRLKGP